MSVQAALIFAAGLGERMRPLTDHTPKPLLEVGGKPLVVWHLENLARSGVKHVVLNTSWLAGQFEPALGDGSRWGLKLSYVYEGATPLETGGGMHNAMQTLQEGCSADAPFIAVNGDIWSDYDFSRLPDHLAGLAHLILVDNPVQHPTGDFALADDGQVHSTGTQTLTFSGIGVYSPRLLDGWQHVIGDAPGSEATPPRFKLAPLLRHAMQDRRVTGAHHNGHWTDVGTPDRLAALNVALA